MPVTYDPRKTVLKVYWAGYKNPGRCEAMDGCGTMWVCQANRGVAIGDMLISDMPATRFPPATLYVRDCFAVDGMAAEELRTHYFPDTIDTHERRDETAEVQAEA